MIAKENSGDDQRLAAEIGSFAIAVDDATLVHVIHPSGYVKHLLLQQLQSSKDLKQDQHCHEFPDSSSTYLGD